MHNLEAELPGVSLVHGHSGNVTFTSYQAELWLFRVQLVQLLAAFLDFLRKISTLLLLNRTSKQMVEIPAQVSQEGPPGGVNLLETPLSSATLAPNAALIRTGKFKSSSGPHTQLTATEGASHRENFLCLYCASSEHFFSCPLRRPKGGESSAQPGPKGPSCLICKLQARDPKPVCQSQGGTPCPACPFQGGTTSLIFRFQRENPSLICRFQKGTPSLVCQLQRGTPSLICWFKKWTPSLICRFQSGTPSFTCRFKPL